MDTIDNASTLLAAGRVSAGQQKVLRVDGEAPVYINANGTPNVVDFAAWEKWQPNPARKRANILVSTLDSFIQYLDTHKEMGTIVVIKTGLNGNAPEFISTIDYHSMDVPGWREHTITLVLTLDHDWMAFQEKDDQFMTQSEFAEFLDDNGVLFSSPSGADLLELITNLEGHSNASIKSHVRLRDGTIRLTYDEEAGVKSKTTSQEVILPDTINLSVPVFVNGAPYPLKARLRYQVGQGRVSFKLKLNRPQDVVKTCLQDMANILEEKTSIKPLWF